MKGVLETNHRNPSRHRIVDYNMQNWLKDNRMLMNAGTLNPERVTPFTQLLEQIEKYKHILKRGLSEPQKADVAARFEEFKVDR